jgi:predicted nucleic acid-binding protein
MNMAGEHKKVIIDSGPLVAFLNKNDQFHNWAVSQFALLFPPFYTCESVISEVCFLLRNTQNGQQNMLRLIDRDLIKLQFKLEAEISLIRNLINKYNDVPMSLADACLVRMSEQITNSLICTLDSDFKVYRKDKRKVIPVLIPENL